MADEESESRGGAAMTQDQFALLMGAFSASQARMEERFTEFRAEIRLEQEDAAAKALKRARYVVNNDSCGVHSRPYHS